MKKLTLALFCLFFGGALAASAWDSSVQLVTGQPTRGGTVQFTLTAPDGSRLSVSAVIASGDKPNSKASKIGAAVTASTAWGAQVTSNMVQFQHWEVDPWDGTGEWRLVQILDSLVDTSGGSLRLQTSNTCFGVDLVVDSRLSAAGVDQSGRPSVISFFTNGGFVWTRVINPGEAPATILEDLYNALQGAGYGVAAYQGSPNEISVGLSCLHSFVSYEITDVNLQPGTTASARTHATVSGLIDR